MKAEMFLMRGLLAVCAVALLIGLGSMLLTQVPAAPNHIALSRLAHTASVPSAAASCANEPVTVSCK